MTTTPSENDLEKKITKEEMFELFGAEMPLEAVQLVFGGDDSRTVGEVRKQLREMAARLRERCEAYKGQVWAGAREIERLESLTVAGQDRGDLAKAIYAAWMKDERWKRDDLAIVAKGKPLAYFWAEVAAAGILKDAEGSGDAGKMREALQQAERMGYERGYRTAQTLEPIIASVPAPVVDREAENKFKAWAHHPVPDETLAYRAGAGQLDCAPEGVEAMRERCAKAIEETCESVLSAADTEGREIICNTNRMKLALATMLRALPLSPQAAGEEKR